jgi:hypothetical protein
MPFEMKSGIDFRRLRAAGAEGFAHPTWNSYFPEQFRHSSADGVIVADVIRGSACQSLSGIHPSVANPRSLAIFLDRTTACLVVFLDLAAEARSNRIDREIYDKVCLFQEKAAREAMADFLKGAGIRSGEPEFTWSFSINILFAHKGRVPRERLFSAFRSICHPRETGSPATPAPGSEASMEHYVGTTGALCIVPAANEPEYSWQRVVGLWTTFQCYYAIAQARYLSFSRSEVPKRARRNRSLIEKDIQYYEETYNRTVRFLNVFDPANVCTRGFDEAIYDSMWSGFGAERLNQKLQTVMLLFVQNSRDLRGELTRRYETVVQLTLFVLTFTQMVPVIDSILKTEAARYLPEAVVPSTSISLLLMVALALLVFVLARWGSRW